LPVINQPKHSKKKGEYMEQNGRTHAQEDNKKKNTQEGEPQREHQVPNRFVEKILNFKCVSIFTSRFVLYS
jgi:hypothetical protein